MSDVEKIPNESPNDSFLPLTIPEEIPAPASGSARTKLLLVAFRSGEAVNKHPEVRPYLAEGWTVTKAAPRIVQSGQTKLLVVLRQQQNAPVPPPTLFGTPPLRTSA